VHLQGIHTAGPVSITTAVSKTTAPYAAVFGELKFCFSTFFFFRSKLQQIHTRNKKKKLEKNVLLVKKTFKKKKIFSATVFDLRFRRRRTIFAEFKTIF
jgi:hypothetical protein